MLKIIWQYLIYYFYREEIKRLKTLYPNMTHKQAFSTAAKNVRYTFIDLPLINILKKIIAPKYVIGYMKYHKMQLIFE